MVIFYGQRRARSPNAAREAITVMKTITDPISEDARTGARYQMACARLDYVDIAVQGIQERGGPGDEGFEEPHGVKPVDKAQGGLVEGIQLFVVAAKGLLGALALDGYARQAGSVLDYLKLLYARRARFAIVDGKGAQQSAFRRN
jgi:hypothetical protein